MLFRSVLSKIGTISNIYKPFFFFIHENNSYRRAHFYLFFVVLSFLYFLITTYKTLKMIRHGKRMNTKNQYYFLLIYPLFPMIGAIVQSLYFGIAVIWIGSVISILIIYFNVQNTRITIDSLTGIDNRFRFDSYLDIKINNPRKEELLYMLMIDIDKFKEINDKYGHLIGDEAIKNMAQILTKAIPKSDFVARLGGEEFVII